MLTVLLVTLAVVVTAVAAAGLTFFVGMRRRSPIVLRLVRGVARRFVNPRMLKRAGLPGAKESVVHHVGRATGRAYRTPVDAEPTDDGFVIALPYGTTANWVRNVLAAGSATLVRQGVTHRLGHPEIVPLATMADHFPAKDRRGLERVRVDRCMRLRAETAMPAGQARDARQLDPGGG